MYRCWRPSDSLIASFSLRFRGSVSVISWSRLQVFLMNSTFSFPYTSKSTTAGGGLSCSGSVGFLGFYPSQWMGPSGGRNYTHPTEQLRSRIFNVSQGHVKYSSPCWLSSKLGHFWSASNVPSDLGHFIMIMTKLKRLTRTGVSGFHLEPAAQDSWPWDVTNRLGYGFQAGPQVV